MPPSVLDKLANKEELFRRLGDLEIGQSLRFTLPAKLFVRSLRSAMVNRWPHRVYRSKWDSMSRKLTVWRGSVLKVRKVRKSSQTEKNAEVGATEGESGQSSQIRRFAHPHVPKDVV